LEERPVDQEESTVSHLLEMPHGGIEILDAELADCLNEIRVFLPNSALIASTFHALQAKLTPV
jgi:hypothetical protein